MNKECEDLLEKISSLARNASSNLYDELYPNKLGQKIMMQSPELRFVALSKYEGIAIILKDLGADVKQLEDMIETEGKKTQDGNY